MRSIGIKPGITVRANRMEDPKARGGKKETDTRTGPPGLTPAERKEKGNMTFLKGVDD